jgi:hypothetical protein
MYIVLRLSKDFSGVDGGTRHLFLRYYRRALGVPAVAVDAVASALSMPDMEAAQAHGDGTGGEEDTVGAGAAANAPTAVLSSGDLWQWLAALQAAYFNYRCVFQMDFNLFLYLFGLLNK